MDVLKPNLLWIDGQCYRISSSMKADTFNQRTAHYTEENEISCMEVGECELEDYQDNYVVSTTENGKYKSVFNIPRIFFGSIIGPKGSVRMRLQDETRTMIIVPSKTKDGDIVITGDDKKGVISARHRIDLIVASARQKLPFTHFLSIPAGSKQIQTKFLQFKDEICRKFTNHRIDASIFQTQEKLHLTLGTMVLGSNVEEKKVGNLLQAFKETYVDPLLRNKTLRLRMIGVEYMNDDPREVDVLYGKVQLTDGSTMLQQIAEDLVDFFQKEGFMTNKYDQVKLHVTLMNTLFRDNSAPGVADHFHNTSMPIKKPRETFDASGILKAYQNYDFGEQIVNMVHLSQRFSTGSDGYYQMITCLKL